MPPVDLRERVSGTRDAAEFDLSGRRTVDEWRRALGSCGVRPRDLLPRHRLSAAGAGAALRFSARSIWRPVTDLVGLDTDAEAIAWLGGTMPGVTVRVARSAPSGPYGGGERGSRSCRTASSPTSPRRCNSSGWRNSIGSSRPGGILVTSVHGAKAFRRGFLRLAVRHGRWSRPGRTSDSAMDGQGISTICSARRKPSDPTRNITAPPFHDIAYIAPLLARGGST